MFSGLFNDEYEEYMNIPLTIYVTDNKFVFVHTYYVDEDEVKLGERKLVKYKIKSNWTVEPLIESMIQAVSIDPNVRV